MGLKAALSVLAVGFGAYYAYSMTDSVSGNDPTTTTTGAAHPLPSASGSENLPDPQPQPLHSAAAVNTVEKGAIVNVGKTSNGAALLPIPLHKPSARPPWSHWLEAHGVD